MTDPIADMLTRVRNAQKARLKEARMPLSKIKVEIARILKEEGYIKDFKVSGDKLPRTLTVQMKYTEDNEVIMTKIKRESKPGLRRYVSKDNIPSVLNGLGISILSTSKGLLTGDSARELGVGGEFLCSIY
jgi:small subunit ribosomal protein S8